MADTVIGTDATGYEVLENAMRALLNEFPGLDDDETVRFEDIGEESGLIFSNNSGALIYTEKEDVIGNIHQTCRYSFFIVYRLGNTAKETAKLSVIEFLDAFGKWLCREDSIIDGTTYHLSSFPALDGQRKIKRITREMIYATDPKDNGVQDWVLPITVSYNNDFTP